MNELEKLIELLTAAINGENFNIKIVDQDGVVQITYGNEEFDDSEVIEEVENYTDVIDELDDCIFVDVCEELEEYMDIKEFDELLNKEHYTEEEADRVLRMIETSKCLIKEHVNDAICELEKFRDKL